MSTPGSSSRPVRWFEYLPLSSPFPSEVWFVFPRVERSPKLSPQACVQPSQRPEGRGDWRGDMRRRIIGLVMFAVLGSAFALGQSGELRADRRDLRGDRMDRR